MGIVGKEKKRSFIISGNKDRNIKTKKEEESEGEGKGKELV
jgi:hypothetical protein